MSVAKFPFWRVVPGSRDDQFILPVTRSATVGAAEYPFVMGGVCLAAAIDALELASGMPVLWSNIQFLSPTQGAEELVIDCEQIGGGRSVGQWQAKLRIGERTVQHVSAALGAREPSEQEIFAQMPDVPLPEKCEPVEGPPWGAPGALHDQIEMRLAAQNFDRGEIAIWTRKSGGFHNDAGWLAIVSDFFLGGHPRSAGGSSLDATFRFIQSSEPGWVLSVTDFAAFDRGVVHGSARHFAQDGALVAISSQTGVLPRSPMA